MTTVNSELLSLLPAYPLHLYSNDALVRKEMTRRVEQQQRLGLTLGLISEAPLVGSQNPQQQHLQHTLAHTLKRSSSLPLTSPSFSQFSAPTSTPSFNSPSFSRTQHSQIASNSPIILPPIIQQPLIGKHEPIRRQDDPSDQTPLASAYFEMERTFIKTAGFPLIRQKTLDFSNCTLDQEYKDEFERQSPSTAFPQSVKTTRALLHRNMKPDIRSNSSTTASRYSTSRRRRHHQHFQYDGPRRPMDATFSSNYLPHVHSVRFSANHDLYNRSFTSNSNVRSQELPSSPPPFSTVWYFSFLPFVSPSALSFFASFLKFVGITPQVQHTIIHLIESMITEEDHNWASILNKEDDLDDELRNHEDREPNDTTERKEKTVELASSSNTARDIDHETSSTGSLPEVSEEEWNAKRKLLYFVLSSLQVYQFKFSSSTLKEEETKAVSQDPSVASPSLRLPDNDDHQYSSIQMSNPDPHDYREWNFDIVSRLYTLSKQTKQLFFCRLLVARLCLLLCGVKSDDYSRLLSLYSSLVSVDSRNQHNSTFSMLAAAITDRETNATTYLFSSFGVPADRILVMLTLLQRQFGRSPLIDDARHALYCTEQYEMVKDDQISVWKVDECFAFLSYYFALQNFPSTLKASKFISNIYTCWPQLSPALG